VSCTASNRLVFHIWDTGPIHYWKLLQITAAFQKHKSTSNELDMCARCGRMIIPLHVPLEPEPSIDGSD